MWHRIPKCLDKYVWYNYIVLQQYSSNSTRWTSNKHKNMDSMDYEATSGSSSPPQSSSPRLQGQTDGTVPQTQYPMQPPMGLPPASSDRPYNQLANFEIEKKIGRGQFSTVFRARCKKNGTIVALKKVQVISFYCAVQIRLWTSWEMCKFSWVSKQKFFLLIGLGLLSIFIIPFRCSDCS
jgi:hypothetical protein